MWKFLFLALVFFFGTLPVNAKNAKDMAWEITAAHRSITHENGWLNTSRPLTTDDLKGRIILVDFWTYCCINCMHIIPELQDIEKTYGDKVTVIGVHSAKFQNERDSENIRSAILRYGILHPVVNDGNFYIWQKFGVHAWPTLVLINPLGRIEEVFSGEGNGGKIKKSIDGMLKSYAGLMNTAPLPISPEKNKQPKSVLSFPGKIIYVEDYEGQPALFISDSGNNRILGIRISGQVFLQIGSGAKGQKDGDFAAAKFNAPQGLLYRDGILYVADTGNHLLRKIELGGGKIETVAGTGEQGENRNISSSNALKTRLSSPWDLAFYPDENHIAIAIAGLHQIWDYSLEKKTLSVIAGNGYEDLRDGPYPLNSLAQTSGLSAAQGRLYFVDSETSSLRYMEDGQVKTLVGKGLFDFGFTEGNIDHALMQHPLGLFADDKEIFIADSYNHSIRKFALETGKLENYLGNGARGDAVGDAAVVRLNEPNAIVIGGGKMFIADTDNNAIKVYDVKTGKVSNLNVVPSPETEKESTEYQENLPNLKVLDFAKVTAKQEIKVTIKLPRGMKINAEAPSWISLFAVEGARFNLVEKYKPEQMRGPSISLPKLAIGKSYKLQGTLYYCASGAKCYLQSIEKLLKAEKSGARSLTINIGDSVK